MKYFKTTYEYLHGKAMIPCEFVSCGQPITKQSIEQKHYPKKVYAFNCVEITKQEFDKLNKPD